ncbi:MAG: carbohydrate binding family 9 domain-containing protein [Acidobacteria bacterium]|nr:carbohydrate binding family 9 domain-containing protein [Acidobacteriota bacterium]
MATALRLVEGAAQAQTPTLRIPRVSRPPALEEFLHSTPQEAGVRITDFRQHQPGDGVPVSQETMAYLSYDDTSLYVVFVCKDEPGKIRARLAKREAIFSDDLVGVFLDTFHDHQRAYEFLTNPLGIQLDGIATEGQEDDFSFDTLWHSEGRLTADGFIVWIAIPFKSLRFSNAPHQIWGIALGRLIPRNNELSFWPYITQRVEGFVQQMATLEGLEHISPGPNLQFIPYGVFTRARFLDTQMPAFRTDTSGRGGLDAKIVLRDAITLDITLNPDFSQVESDEPQVTVNQRFEVFFPEKRPFFIKNAGFFETRDNLFFSRRIADPRFGVRLTGKVGRWAIGALAIDDRAPGKRVPEDDPLRDGRAGIGVVRVRREFANQSAIGLLVTSRDVASSSNRVFSLDTRLKLNPNWILSGQVMQSDTRQLDGTRLSGPAYLAQLFHGGRHFNYFGRFLDRSPSFRSQLGFIPRVDVRQMEHFANYRWPPEGRRVLPNVSLVALERTKRMTADFLITYLVNPGTAIYAGYTHGYENLAIDPTQPPTLRRIGSPTVSTGRQFFIKASYLLRF